MGKEITILGKDPPNETALLVTVKIISKLLPIPK